MDTVSEGILVMDDHTAVIEGVAPFDQIAVVVLYPVGNAALCRVRIAAVGAGFVGTAEVVVMDVTVLVNILHKTLVLHGNAVFNIVQVTVQSLIDACVIVEELAGFMVEGIIAIVEQGDIFEDMAIGVEVKGSDAHLNPLIEVGLLVVEQIGGAAIFFHPAGVGVHSLQGERFGRHCCFGSGHKCSGEGVGAVVDVDVAQIKTAEDRFQIGAVGDLLLIDHAVQILNRQGVIVEDPLGVKGGILGDQGVGGDGVTVRIDPSGEGVAGAGGFGKLGKGVDTALGFGGFGFAGAAVGIEGHGVAGLVVEASGLYHAYEVAVLGQGGAAEVGARGIAGEAVGFAADGLHLHRGGNGNGGPVLKFTEEDHREQIGSGVKILLRDGVGQVAIRCAAPNSFSHHGHS